VLTEPFTIGTQAAPIAPQVVTVADYNANYADYESELIEIDNAAITNTGSHTDTQFQASRNYDVTVGADVTTLRTVFSNLVNVNIPTGNVNVVGIAGVYQRNGTGTAHPQIYPRDEDDLIPVTAIQNNNIDGFKLYPNPVVGENIYVTSDNQDEKHVSIYNVLGKEVISVDVNNGNAINVSQLKAGIYLVKVIENSHVAIQKLIIR
jgi:hypothetical protein